MTAFFLQVESNKFYTSILSLNVIQTGETEKAVKFNLEDNTISFWIPKSAIKFPKTGIMKGKMVLANWFKFQSNTFNKIKDYIEHTEITSNGFFTAN